ncbi:Ionotropic receptor 41a3 [Blattella germanica]|nr:Ionotropic receptor 41a3 [Blattella germanica]
MKLLWLCFVAAVWGNPPLPEDEESVVGDAVQHVVGKYFSQSFCVGVVYERRSTFAHLVRGVPLVLHEASDDSAATLEEFLDQKCLDIMVQVADVRAMVQRLCRASRASKVRSTRRFLFLPNAAAVQEANANGVFAMEEMAVLPDLVVAKLAEGNASLQFVTHRYAGDHPEEEVALGEGELFPDKLRDLEGKELALAAVPDYPPYTILDLGASPPLYEGVELRVAKDFAKTLNFSFHVLVDADAWWGEVWPNGTGTGMWGMVATDVAALGFGATYAWLENYPYLDYSLPYFRSSVRCITPRPRQLPGWMTPLLPFDALMWTAVGASLGVTIAALYLATNAIMRLLDSDTKERLYSTLTSSVMWSWGLLLLQSPSVETQPLYVPLRHLVTWLMVYYLLVNSIYSGGLAAVLTVPRFEHPINSVADLAGSNMIWAATLDAWVYSIEEATEPDLKHIVRNYRTLGEEELLRRAFKGDTAFAVERLLGGNYALPSYINNETVPLLRAMQDDIYSGSPVFNVRKASPFLKSLNMLILRLNAAGLLLNYEVQVVREFVGQRIQLALAQNDQVAKDSGPVALRVDHIQGPLFFLGFGLTAAFLVFVSEVLKMVVIKKKALNAK